MPSHSEYLDGIHDAIEAGDIEFLDPSTAPYGPDFDSHTHITKEEWNFQGSLYASNTRPLMLVASMALELLARRRRMLCCLEIGPGPGKALYDLSMVAQRLGVAMTVDTVALTPFHPRWVPRYTYGRLAVEVQALAETSMENLFGGMPPLPFAQVLELNERAPHFLFAQLPEGFVRKQWIGYFAECDVLPEGEYDLIYTNRAAYRHSPDADAVSARTLPALKEDGVLIAAPYRFTRDFISEETEKPLFDPDRDMPVFHSSPEVAQGWSALVRGAKLESVNRDMYLLLQAQALRERAVAASASLS